MGIVRGFKGGVHPPYMKYTADKPIQDIGIPEVLYVPLQQHAGAPSKPLVKRGDRVLAGQKIGEINGFISANIHAPTSGKVKNILDHPHPTAGRSLPAVVIEADGQDEWIELHEREDYLNAEPNAIVEAVKEAGVVGMGGAAFPTHVKLSPPPDKPIEFVIINGAECEPFLTADDRLMREYADEIANGSYLILRAVGAKKGFVGIEDNKPEAIEKMRKAFRQYPQFEVVELPTKYPQGSEKHLIKALTGREVPSRGLPMDVGAVVQNVGTARAVYHAVRYGKPLVERVTTLTGDAVAGPGNYMVRIGTTFNYLVQKTGGLKEKPAKLINGGPMMGIAQYTFDVPVIKGTSGVIVF
jgi:electron transport complex protein RnfC